MARGSQRAGLCLAQQIPHIALLLIQKMRAMNSTTDAYTIVPPVQAEAMAAFGNVIINLPNACSQTFLGRGVSR